ncbi:hypothetical protein F441_18306 [Phytophthora nicotianae CJ01A1]|uniref:START domain-containing protein n=2 Tax=Phytophthora nicotianae TaxID=4792 RepID=W2W4T7_PHYNI|nr:hypothetical protein L916_17829 [Phytophthora nicotianae]ETP05008.1 hypothetical protein F441_18306 [Phytophthora nicotianae CJ01A1]
MPFSEAWPANHCARRSNNNVSLTLQQHHMSESLYSTESPFNVSAFTEEPMSVETHQPKKKRIRRVKQELDYLRRESKKLEDELAQLHTIQANRPAGAISFRPRVTQTERVTTSREYCAIAPRLRQKPSMWQAIAERQSRERGRVLARNMELRAQLETEYKLGKQLIQLLDRQIYAKALIQEKRHGLLWGHADVFKQQLQQSENTLLEVKRVLQGPPFRDPTACFLDTFIEKNGDKEVFVVQSNATLPFGMQATASALWKVLSTDQIKNYCYHHQIAQKSDTIVAQSFGIRFKENTVDADFRGKYTFSRFTDGDCIVIVWVGACEPIELNGIKCRDIQSQTTGWVQISEQRSEEMKGTLVRSYSRLSVDSGDDEKPQSGALLGLAQFFHDKFMATHYSVLEKSLIEEDWKMNSGWGGSQSG